MKDDIISPFYDEYQPVHTEQSTVFAQNLFSIASNEEMAAKNRRVERASIILLVVLGVCAGLVNGGIIFCNGQLSHVQAILLTDVGKNDNIGFLYFLITMIIFVLIASGLCKFFTKAAAGSGLPEFKSLLASSDLKTSDYEKLVSRRIFLTKIFGLVFSVGSGLSCGTEGPLVHVSACVAHLLMKYVHEFELILDSPSVVKQIFAASAAVGISSAFNAPVGGLLFSVEATTTFYLISNYWKSCIAAASGAVVCYFCLTNPEEDPLLLLKMGDGALGKIFVKWELLVFFVIGVMLAYMSIFYLYLHQRMNILLRPYNKDRPLFLATCVAILTAILIFLTGQYNGKSLGVLNLVSDVLNEGQIVEMKRYGTNPIGSLLLSFLVRSFLTLMATNISVPAGIFMPVFLIGGLFGRFIGHIIQECAASNPSIVINISAYALVGAVAFASGITQTVSVAVIAVELTGNIGMFLPLLVVAVVAAGISKANTLSVYDQGMLNKGLENFQLLLTDTGGFKFASEVMNTDVKMVKKVMTCLQIVEVMHGNDQSVFPVVDEEEDDKLIGSISRRCMYSFLKAKFLINNDVDDKDKTNGENNATDSSSSSSSSSSFPLLVMLRDVLPVDAAEDDDFTVSKVLREERALRRKKMKESLAKTGADLKNYTDNFLFDTTEEANAPVKVKKSKKGASKIRKSAHDNNPDDIESNIDMPHGESGSRENEKRTNISSGCTNEDMGDKINGNTPGTSQVWDLASSASKSAISIVNSGVAKATDSLTKLVHQARTNQNGADSLESTRIKYFLADFQTVPETYRDVVNGKVNVLNEDLLPINAFPFSVARNSPMESVYVLFEMVKASSIFVLQDGKLQGLITTDELLRNLREKCKTS